MLLLYPTHIKASKWFFYAKLSGEVYFCNQFGYKVIFLRMRVIAVKTLKRFWEIYPLAKPSLLAWYQEAISAEWTSPAVLKEQYRSASILTNKRVVFNIKGNDYRLVVDIEYRLGIVFIVWMGTHNEYEKLDIKLINYVKTN